jgi:hypothetical protein
MPDNRTHGERHGVPDRCVWCTKFDPPLMASEAGLVLHPDCLAGANSSRAWTQPITLTRELVLDSLRATT